MLEPRSKATPRKSPANAKRMGDAERALRDALGAAAVEGYFGEVRLCVTLQDGVIQKLNVENSRVIR